MFTNREIYIVPSDTLIFKHFIMKPLHIVSSFEEVIQEDMTDICETYIIRFSNGYKANICSCGAIFFWSRRE